MRSRPSHVLRNLIFTFALMPNHPTDDDQLRATAFHEAGHAVMAFSLGRVVSKVSIKPGQSAIGQSNLGTCALGKGRSKATKDQLEDEVLILFAGMVAESHFTGQYNEQGAKQDLSTAYRMLEQRANNEKQLDRTRKRLLDKTDHILSEDGHAKAIELIADELIAKETVSGRAVRHFFKQATSTKK